MVDEHQLRLRELDLKEQELKQRREEAQAKLAVERRNVWFTSPLLVALFSAFVGLLGTGIGAVMQGYWNTTLERQKFESALIQKALETTNKEDAAQNLRFLVEGGLITGFDTEKITKLAAKPDRLPTLFVPRSLMPVSEAKQILSRLGFYKGPLDDRADEAFYEAVRAYQKSKGLVPDGMIGIVTVTALRDEALQKAPSDQPPKP
jgi:hypothetical protein